MDADEDGTAEVWDRPVTFDTAMELGGFELARQWADRMSWPWPTDRTARDDLAEVAYMSALAEWLRRWQPIHIHRALLAGVQLEELAPATGADLNAVFRLWRQWASGQRDLGRPVGTDQEYTTVEGIFALGGFTSPDVSSSRVPGLT